MPEPSITINKATRRNGITKTYATVARLDEYADIERVTIDGDLWTKHDLRQSVARELSYQLGRHGWGMGRKVTTREIRFMLIAAGASTFTIEQHARAIASLVRGDYSAGGVR